MAYLRNYQSRTIVHLCKLLREWIQRTSVSELRKTEEGKGSLQRRVERWGPRGKLFLQLTDHWVDDNLEVWCGGKPKLVQDYSFLSNGIDRSIKLETLVDWGGKHLQLVGGPVWNSVACVYVNQMGTFPEEGAERGTWMHASVSLSPPFETQQHIARSSAWGERATV